MLKNASWILLVFLQLSLYGQVDRDSLVGLAERLYIEQDYQNSLGIYESLADSDSTNVQHLYRAGTAAQRLGDFKKAKDYLHKLEKIDTTNHTYARPLASIYEIEGNVPKAILYYTNLSKENPDNSLFYRKLGQQYLKGGETGDAFTNFNKSHKLNPNDFFTVQGLADIFSINKQYQDANVLLRKAIAYDESNLNLQLLYTTNKYKQAQFDTTATVLYGLRGKLDFSNYYNKMLGYSLMQIDSTEKAIFYLRKSLVNEGNPEIAHYYLSKAYEDMEEMDYATHHLEKAIDAGISKNLKSYHSNLARLQESSGNKKDAIRNYEAAYRYSSDPIYLFYLGRLTDEYYKDKSVAIRYYDRYAQSKDENIEYKRYAVDRKIYLREQQHFNTSK